MPSDFEQFTRDWVERELGPLFEQAGSSARVLAVEGDRVTLSFSGALAGAPGAHYVADEVIRPGLDAKLGRKVELVVVPHVWLPDPKATRQAT